MFLGITGIPCIYSKPIQQNNNLTMKTQLITLVLVLISFLMIFSCDPPEPPTLPICPSTPVTECSPKKKIRKTHKADTVAFELIVELQPGYTQGEVLKDCNYEVFKFQLATDFLGIDPDSIYSISPLRECNCSLMLLDIEVLDSIWIDINNGPAGSMSPPEDQNEGIGLIASAGLNYDINVGPFEGPEIAINTKGKSCAIEVRSPVALDTFSNCGGELSPLGDSTPKGGLTVVGLIDTGTDPRHDYGRADRGNYYLPKDLFYLPRETEPLPKEIFSRAPGKAFEFDNSGQQNAACVANALWGYDYYHEDNNPLDRKGHGTHIAGTILSVGKFQAKQSGIRMMTMQIGGYRDNNLDNDFFECDLFAIICAVNYAVENGADIINMSLGYYSAYYHVPFYRQLKKAAAAEILVVTSLGNDTTNVDSCPHWPSNFSRIFPDNVIAVAALDTFTRDDVNFQLAQFSNYGQHADIAAPGWMIRSAMAGTHNDYILLSGTSMAAAVVSRRAAMIRDSVVLAGETITGAQIKTQILQEAEYHPNVCVKDGKVLTPRSDASLLEDIGYQ